MPLPTVNCGDCGAPMALAIAADGPREGRPLWSCETDGCGATHGAHPDGTPLGVPGDAPTRAARRRAHDAFDRLWRLGYVETRSDAYDWLRKTLRLSEEEAHIGRFGVDRCWFVIRLCDAFVSRSTPSESPIVLAILDPWGLASPGTDPEQLRGVGPPPGPALLDQAAPAQAFEPKSRGQCDGCKDVHVELDFAPLDTESEAAEGYPSVGLVCRSCFLELTDPRHRRGFTRKAAPAAAPPPPLDDTPAFEAAEDF